MAILVYKQGSSHVIRGVQCDFARIEPKELDLYLENGYVKDPKELLVKKSVGYTEEELSELHYKKVDKIAVSMGIPTDGDKYETIKLILEKQDG